MKKWESISDYLFLAPAFLIYTMVVIGPTLYTAFLSFFKWNGVGPKVFVGLNNYINLITKDKVFWLSLKNNLIWVVLTLVIIMALALAFALLFNQDLEDVHFQKLFLFSLYLILYY